jgi:hypothetical protein
MDGGAKQSPCKDKAAALLLLPRQPARWRACLLLRSARRACLVHSQRPAAPGPACQKQAAAGVALLLLEAAIPRQHRLTLPPAQQALQPQPPGGSLRRRRARRQCWQATGATAGLCLAGLHQAMVLWCRPHLQRLCVAFVAGVPHPGLPRPPCAACCVVAAGLLAERSLVGGPAGRPALPGLHPQERAPTEGAVGEAH